MKFYNAKILDIKFLNHPSRWMYFRLGNAAELWFLWIKMTWRMNWLPQTAYQMGWDDCYRQFMNGKLVLPEKVVNSKGNAPDARGLTLRAVGGVARAAEYGATSNCVDCGKRIVFCGDGVWLHCEPQNHGHARPNGAIVNPPRN